jgi:hypothetical protein
VKNSKKKQGSEFDFLDNVLKQQEHNDSDESE